MKVGIIVGEPSGDKLAASLIEELSKNNYIEVIGILGPELKKFNHNELFNMEEICVMGFIEPLKILPKLISIKNSVVDYFIKNPPDLFIGVDAPDFNFRVEKKLKKYGIPVVHYVSPSVWAWRQGRVNFIKKYIDLMLVLFPHEQKFYEKHNVNVEFVGHPFSEKIPKNVSQENAKKELNIKGDNILILPGSRKKEIIKMIPIFSSVAKEFLKEKQAVITVAVLSKEHEELVKKYLPHDFNPKFVVNKTYLAISACDAALVTSGTATLEVMMHKKPMVIGYKVNFLAYHILRLVIKTKYIGLPNILAEKEIVPEFIGYKFDIKKIKDSLVNIMYNKNCLEKFDKLNNSLRKNAAQLAANAIEKKFFRGQICTKKSVSERVDQI